MSCNALTTLSIYAQVKSLETKSNVDQCISVGKDHVKSFYDSLWDGLHDPLSKKVVTMVAGKSSLKVGDVNVLETTLIYSRVLALKITNSIIEVNVLFSY